MLEESTITKAAEKAGISRDTAYKYLKNENFQAELNKRRTSPESNTIPSRILPATPLISAINSSNKVAVLPSGSLCGTGENSFPKAEY